MAQDESKKLTEGFNAASMTETLLKKIKYLKEEFEKQAKGAGSFAALPIVVGATVLGVCEGIVVNQLRQDEKISALEKRLKDLEGGGPAVKLDKGPNPPQP